MSKKALKVIYVVDDQPEKRRDIIKVAERLFPECEIRSFACAGDFIEHLKGLENPVEESKERLVLSDMQMPIEAGKPKQADGGLWLLEKMGHSGEFGPSGLHCPTIIISSTPPDQGEAKSRYSNYLAAAGYCCWDLLRMERDLRVFLEGGGYL